MVQADEEDGSKEQTQVFLPKGHENAPVLINGAFQGVPSGSSKKDFEMEKCDAGGGDPYWNPFRARNVANPTTDCETLTHLLKACLGTGILAMPYAFKSAGITFGIVSTIIVGLICTHCSYVLVKCAQALYYRSRISFLTFPDVGHMAFAKGPPAFRVFAKPARIAVICGIFLTYFGTCSAYAVIIAENMQQVVEHYSRWPLDMRWYIVGLLVPLILLSWIPNLKALTIFSMTANLLMGMVILITLYYIVFSTDHQLSSPWDLPQMAPLSQLPEYFSITIFAMEAIGVMIPLENNMANPRHFLGGCGILNRGMSMVSMIYLMIGFLGYLKYGSDIRGTISLNLPNEELSPQVAKIFTSIAIFCTYGLQFYVCLEIVWNEIKDRFSKNSKLYNYILRTGLAVLSVVVALMVPKIGPFLGLVGALFFSFLGIILPVFLEFVVFWDAGYGTLKWRLWKNILILLFGIMALIFGTHSSMAGIIDIYSTTTTTPTLLAESTLAPVLANNTIITPV